MAIKKPISVERQEKVYNSLELYNFEIELNRYKIINSEGKAYLTVGGEYAYLQSQGIVQAKGKIKPEIKTLSDLPDWRIDLLRISDYTEYLNKKKQYDAWKFKKDFAAKRQLDGWDKVAKSMPEMSQNSDEEISKEEWQ